MRSTQILFTILLAMMSGCLQANDLSISNTSPLEPEPQVIQSTEPSVVPQVKEAIESISNDQELDRNFVLNLQKYDKNLYCLAQNAYYEAGGESLKGKIAVVQVVENRTESPQFPDTPCGVINQRIVRKINGKDVTTCQFSWICNGKGTIPLRDSRGQIRERVYQQWYDSVKAAIMVTRNQIDDLVHGATHFYAHNQVQPRWTSNMRKVSVIGNHTFMKFK